METPPSRILVIRLSSLGDVILTTPLFKNLRDSFPQARLGVLVKKAFAPVFDGNPWVDEVLTFEERGLWGWAAEMRRRRFDVVIDLHDTWRSRVWGALSGADRVLRYDKRSRERRRLVRTKASSPRLSQSVVHRYLETLAPLRAPAAFHSPRLFPIDRPLPVPLGKGPFLGLAPGAAHAGKRWPAENFAEAANRLLPEAFPGGKVLIFGGPQDREAAAAVERRLTVPVLNLAGKTTLPELFLALRACGGLLTNDSGLMHAAAALEVPVTAVFGPTVEAFGFFPEGARAKVLQVDGLPCRPCHLHGPAFCPLGHFRCMRDLSVGKVVEAARTLLL